MPESGRGVVTSGRSARPRASNNAVSLPAWRVAIEILRIRMPRSAILPAGCAPVGHSMIIGAAPPRQGEPSSLTAIRQRRLSRDMERGRPMSTPTDRALAHAASSASVEATQASGNGDAASLSITDVSSSPNHLGLVGAAISGSFAITSRYVSGPVAVTRLCVAIFRWRPPAGISMPHVCRIHRLPDSRDSAPMTT